jgi:hypothetical protein
MRAAITATACSMFFLLWLSPSAQAVSVATRLPLTHVSAAAPIPALPSSAGLPTVSNLTRNGSVAVVGDTLSTDLGRWTHVPTAFTYQWFRCASSCTAIADVNMPTYPVTSADQGYTLESVVTAINLDGLTSQISGNRIIVAAAPVVQAAPHIVASGVNMSGQSVPTGTVLSLAGGMWGASGVTDALTYVWEDCGAGGACAAIAGAHGLTYTTTAADVGRSIVAQVTASNIAGDAEVLTSATGIVKAAPTSLPTITRGLQQIAGGIGASVGSGAAVSRSLSNLVNGLTHLGVKH